MGRVPILREPTLEACFGLWKNYIEIARIHRTRLGADFLNSRIEDVLADPLGCVTEVVLFYRPSAPAGGRRRVRRDYLYDRS